jgi:serine/threonine protein kinase
MTRDRDDQHQLDQTLAAPGTDTVDATDLGNERTAAPALAGSLARYQLASELGRGGMGEVLSARDKQIGRNVAIKRLRATPTAETEARFLREARIQGRLDHPAIVPVHELGRDDRDQPFFAMKQLAGKTLAEVLAQPEAERKFTRKQLLRALIDVSLATQFAHERGVVHRDLKPPNIMLGDYGEVYVLDWGIARVLQDAERTSFPDIDTLGEVGETLAGQLLGTPGYMSPEQIRGEIVDGRADVYALGCILFELLVGTTLHPRGKDALVATVAGASQTKPSLRKPEADIAPELDQLCVAATALALDNRTPTARMFGDTIQAYLDGDRDFELRRQLAEVELASAKSSLARGESVEDRRAALRAATRALALDPEAKEPAQLVGRLMLEPPAEVPPEVDAEVAQLERKALEATARQGNKSLFVVLAFLPILYFGGIDDPWYIVPIPLLTAVVWFGAWLQHRYDNRWGLVLSLLANMTMVAVFSRLVSPFLVAPAMGIMIATLFALHRASGPAIFLGLGFGLAILGPWFLELLGVLSPTMRFTASELVLDPTGSHLQPEVLLPMLGLYVSATLAVGIAMSRSLATAQHASQRHLQLQAWQLRQLVPETR